MIAPISDDGRRQARPPLRLNTRQIRVRVENLESRFLLSGIETRSAGASPLILPAAMANTAQVAKVSNPGFVQIVSNLSDDQAAALNAGTAVMELPGLHDRPENAQRLPDTDQTRVFGVLDAGDPADLYKLTIHPGTRSIQADFRWGKTPDSPPAHLRLLNEQGDVLGDQPTASWGASTLFNLDQPPDSETTLYLAVVRTSDATPTNPDYSVGLSAPYDLAILRQGPNPDTGQNYNPAFPGGSGRSGQSTDGSGQLGPPPGIPTPEASLENGSTLSGTSPATIPVSNVSVTPSGISLPTSPSEPASGLLGSYRPAPTYNQRDTADVDLNLISAPTSYRVPSSTTPEATTADAEPSVVDLDTTLSIALDALFGATDVGEAAAWRPSTSIPNIRIERSGGPSDSSTLAGSALFDRRETGAQNQGATVNIASLPPLDSLPTVEQSAATPVRTLAGQGTPAASLGHVHTLRRWAMAASLFGSAALMFSLYAPDPRSVMSDARRNQRIKDAEAF